MNEDSGKARLVMASILLILTAGLITLLLVAPPKDEFVKTQLVLVLGVFLAKLGSSFDFYFGTSSGAKTLSAAQAETTKALVEKTSKPEPTYDPGDAVLKMMAARQPIAPTASVDIDTSGIAFPGEPRR